MTLYKLVIIGLRITVVKLLVTFSQLKLILFCKRVLIIKIIINTHFHSGEAVTFVSAWIVDSHAFKGISCLKLTAIIKHLI